MLNFLQTELLQTAIHSVGNKQADEGLELSENLIPLQDNPELERVLTNFYLSKFDDLPFSQFTHPADLKLNDIYNIVMRMFDTPTEFLHYSKNIAQILYDCMEHPKIKGGELYVSYFKGVTYGSEICDAIGIFKSEDKQTFLQVSHEGDICKVNYDQGIETGKLAKGALILNVNKDDGYLICTLDNLNKNQEALYWSDSFLKIKPTQNDYNLTTSVMNMARKYITSQLKEEFEATKTDEVGYINRSIDYFKHNEQFETKEFVNHVFHDKNVAQSFTRFKDDFQDQRGLELQENFAIDDRAVKREGRHFKSIIKLDKNFHIYVHGNRELIEQGTDEKGRKYYKLYYNEEK